MKALTILGAMIGFLTGVGLALAVQSPWPEAFWRGGVAALGGGLLLRWWGRLWVEGWQQTLRARQQAQGKNPGEAKSV